MASRFVGVGGLVILIPLAVRLFFLAIFGGSIHTTLDRQFFLHSTEVCCAWCILI